MAGTQFTDRQLTDWAWHSGGYPDQYSDGQLLISLHLIGWPWRESLGATGDGLGVLAALESLPPSSGGLT